jgi:hypothetical protein
MRRFDNPGQPEQTRIKSNPYLPGRLGIYLQSNTTVQGNKIHHATGAQKTITFTDQQYRTIAYVAEDNRHLRKEFTAHKKYTALINIRNSATEFNRDTLSPKGLTGG